MRNREFFPERKSVNPTIYAYALIDVSSHTGLLKVGFTDRDAFTRVSEQLKTSAVKYKIVFETSAMRNDGSSFTGAGSSPSLVPKRGIDVRADFTYYLARKAKIAVDFSGNFFSIDGVSSLNADDLILCHPPPGILNILAGILNVEPIGNLL